MSEIPNEWDPNKKLEFVKVLIRSIMGELSGKQKKIEEYQNNILSPFVAAQKGYIDGIIEPQETRSKICKALNMLHSKKSTAPLKKHDNLPL